MKIRKTTTWSRRILFVAIVAGAIAGWSAPPVRAQAASASNFPVEFTDCVESIGVTLVPTERARD